MCQILPHFSGHIKIGNLSVLCPLPYSLFSYSYENCVLLDCVAFNWCFLEDNSLTKRMVVRQKNTRLSWGICCGGIWTMIHHAMLVAFNLPKVEQIMSRHTDLNGLGFFFDILILIQ